MDGSSMNHQLLTDQFKSALSMSRNQMKASPNPLQSSSQIGVNPHHQFQSPLPQFQSPHVQQMAFGSKQSMGEMGGAVSGDPAVVASSSSPSTPSFFSQYGRWLIAIAVIAVACLVFIMWRRRQSMFGKGGGGDSEEAMFSRIRDRDGTNDISQFHPRPLQYQHQRQFQQPMMAMSISDRNVLPLASMIQRTDQPNSPMMTPQNQPPRNLRENEQFVGSVGQRGAEMSNPAAINSMMPVSTRLGDSSPQQQFQPPQNQPQPMNQPQNQNQPPSQNQPMNQPSVVTFQQPQNQPQPMNQPPSQNQPQSQPMNQPIAVMVQQPQNQPQHMNQPSVVTFQQPQNQQQPQSQPMNQPSVVTFQQPQPQPQPQNQPIQLPVSDPNFTSL